MVYNYQEALMELRACDTQMPFNNGQNQPGQDVFVQPQEYEMEHDPACYCKSATEQEQLDQNVEDHGDNQQLRADLSKAAAQPPPMTPENPPPVQQVLPQAPQVPPQAPQMPPQIPSQLQPQMPPQMPQQIPKAAVPPEVVLSSPVRTRPFTPTPVRQEASMPATKTTPDQNMMRPQRYGTSQPGHVKIDTSMRPEIVHHDPSMPNPPRVEQSMPVGGANNLLGGGQRGMITNQHPTSAMVSQFGVPIQQQGYSGISQQPAYYGASNHQQGPDAASQLHIKNAASQQGFYNASQQQGLNAASQQQGVNIPTPGYGASSQQQGFGVASQQQGFGVASQQQGFGVASQQQGMYAPSQQQGFAIQSQQNGMNLPQSQLQGFGVPSQQQGFNTTSQIQGTDGLNSQKQDLGDTTKPTFTQSPPRQEPQKDQASEIDMLIQDILSQSTIEPQITQTLQNLQKDISMTAAKSGHNYIVTAPSQQATGSARLIQSSTGIPRGDKEECKVHVCILFKIFLVIKPCISQPILLHLGYNLAVLPIFVSDLS